MMSPKAAGLGPTIWLHDSVARLGGSDDGPSNRAATLPSANDYASIDRDCDSTKRSLKTSGLIALGRVPAGLLPSETMPSDRTGC